MSDGHSGKDWVLSCSLTVSLYYSVDTLLWVVDTPLCRSEGSLGCWWLDSRIDGHSVLMADAASVGRQNLCSWVLGGRLWDVCLDLGLRPSCMCKTLLVYLR